MKVLRSHLWINRFFVALLCLSGIRVYAEGGPVSDQSQAKWEEILKQPTRPRVSQFLANLKNGSLLTQNPYTAGVHASIMQKRFGEINHTTENYVEAFTYGGPSIIAQLEFAYPDGIYACLGRDTALFSDFLDAFYLTQGRRGRSFVLEGSGKTIAGASEQEIIDWIKGYGFDFQNPDSIRQGPALVLLDTSHYTDSSQSVKILQVLTRAFEAAGGHAAELAHKLNFVNLYARSQFLMINTYKNREDLEKRFFERDRNTGTYPKALALSMTGTNLTHSAEWHASFGTLQVVNGRTVALPGHLQGPAEQRAVAAQIYEMIKIVNAPDFLSKVQDAARLYGLELVFSPVPAEKEVAEVPIKLNFIEQSGKFAQLLNSLKANPEHPAHQRYSANAIRIMNEWFKPLNRIATMNGENETALIFYLSTLMHAYKEKKITDRDARYMLAFALGRLNVSEKSSENFLQLFKKSPELRQLWMEQSDYFVDPNPKRHGGLKIPQTYEALTQFIQKREANLLPADLLCPHDFNEVVGL